jgi:hypothetical protein
MFRSELLRWHSRVELSRTRESQNTQPAGLRFRATLGGDQEAEVTLI